MTTTAVVEFVDLGPADAQRGEALWGFAEVRVGSPVDRVAVIELLCDTCVCWCRSRGVLMAVKIVHATRRQEVRFGNRRAAERYVAHHGGLGCWLVLNVPRGAHAAGTPGDGD